MNELHQKVKTLNRLDLFFMISGFVEVFGFVVLTHNMLLIIVGGVTLFSAYAALDEKRLKWNYFVGIWALVKYNPAGLAVVSYMLSNFFRNSLGSSVPVLITGLAFLVFIVAVTSFVLGIIVIVKTVRYFKSKNTLDSLKKNNPPDNNVLSAEK